MKTPIVDGDERIHVMDSETDVRRVVRNICLSRGQREAFQVLDIGDVVRKHRHWQEKMARVEPYYAVKCNEHLNVIRVLAALGVGFDCASEMEIDRVMDAGVPANRIIFSNPTKPESHIRHAAERGVDLMTFDNEVELHKVKRIFPQARLVIRIRYDDASAHWQLGLKFGCDVIDDPPRLLTLARTLGLQVVGVSFHVGSDCRDPPVFRGAIAAARPIFELGAELGFKMTLLDMGGGFPGVKGTSLDQIAAVVNPALEDYFPSTHVQVIAEPGRFFVASAFTAATAIHSMREVRSDDLQEVKHVMYYVNDGVYGSFLSYLVEHEEPVPIPVCDSTDVIPSSVWGPTCDGLDRLNKGVLLPKMDLGDWILYEDVGAYSLCLASCFNGYPIPKVHTVADRTTWLMLKNTPPLTEDQFVNSLDNIHNSNEVNGICVNGKDVDEEDVYGKVVNGKDVDEEDVYGKVVNGKDVNEEDVYDKVVNGKDVNEEDVYDKVVNGKDVDEEDVYVNGKEVYDKDETNNSIECCLQKGLSNIPPALLLG